MLNLRLLPHCAEWQIAMMNEAQTELVVTPRRPMYQLNTRNLCKTVAPGAIFVALVLYNHHDQDLYRRRNWLEDPGCGLGFNVAMKKRRSREYKKLWDAIYVPCQGPVTIMLNGSRRWTLECEQKLLVKPR